MVESKIFKEYKYFILFYVYFIYYYINWNEEKVIISLILLIFYFFAIIYGNFFFIVFQNYKNFLKFVYNENNYNFINITIGSLIRVKKNNKVIILKIIYFLYSFLICYITSIFGSIKTNKLYTPYYYNRSNLKLSKTIV